MKFTTSTDGDMEILLSVVGKHLGAIGAEGMIDLYTDEPIEDPEPQQAFLEMRQEVQSQHAGKRDYLIGVPLDFASQTDLRRFTLLGHRTIGCEAYVGRKLVFSTVENERIVFLDLPQTDVEALESQARQAGAEGLTRLT
ncbi:hypothetical protein [Streptomyces sp. H27-C3]|uniref:hypothetical protein n=1 Tax=Streptomyces sp. H27-C3 TaxID=3046305 RepID=UPI0024B93F95|nr:hypothetical protein [Streptomyces sp. H27-C3]MDJ0466793.1 hypothetical protein [Streptomyces sp. H27-C3]